MGNSSSSQSKDTRPDIKQLPIPNIESMSYLLYGTVPELDLLPVFQQYWARDPSHHPGMINLWRTGIEQNHLEDDARYRSDPSDLRPEFDISPTQHICDTDEAYHPLVHPSSFVTNLPMEEVMDIMGPALRLATKYLTDEAALAWWIQVRFATLEERRVGPNVLMHNPKPITHDMIQLVKFELEQLAHWVRFSFLGNPMNQRGTNGVTIFCLRSALRELQADRETTAGFFDQYGKLPDCRPYIFLNIRFFKEAMRHHYLRTPITMQRRFQWQLATLLCHELAHAWMDLCWGQYSAGEEPLVFSNDAIPEAGFSWEKYMFDAHIRLWPLGPAEVLVAKDFNQEFRPPHVYPCSVIDRCWIRDFFLKSTWQNFAVDRHHVMTTVKSAESFLVRRFCPHRRKLVDLAVYQRKLLHPLDCCGNPQCPTQEPGTEQLWPDTPNGVHAKIFELFAEDGSRMSAAAREPRDLCHDPGYHYQIRLMEELRKHNRRKAIQKKVRAGVKSSRLLKGQSRSARLPKAVRQGSSG